MDIKIDWSNKIKLNKNKTKLKKKKNNNNKNFKRFKMKENHKK